MALHGGLRWRTEEELGRAAAAFNRRAGLWTGARECVEPSHGALDAQRCLDRSARRGAAGERATGTTCTERRSAALRDAAARVRTRFSCAWPTGPRVAVRAGKAPILGAAPSRSPGARRAAAPPCRGSSRTSSRPRTARPASKARCSRRVRRSRCWGWCWMATTPRRQSCARCWWPRGPSGNGSSTAPQRNLPPDVPTSPRAPGQPGPRALVMATLVALEALWRLFAGQERRDPVSGQGSCWPRDLA